MESMSVSEEGTESHVCGADCISAENLSAFSDGEYTLTPAEKKHLSECPVCRKKLKSLQDLIGTLHQALDEECPPELTQIMSERLKIRTKLEQKEMDSRKYTFSAEKKFFHAAAAILVFAAALYAVIHFTADQPEQIAGNPEQIQKIPESGSVDIRHLVAASAGSPVRFLPQTAANSTERPAVIPAKVKQLWTYPAKQTPSSIVKDLKKYAGKGIIQPNKTPKGISYTLLLSKMQAVRLVRSFAAGGYTLLSPVQPQPEQKTFLGAADEQIVMEITFLPAK